jgi:hypothetical protein
MRAWLSDDTSIEEHHRELDAVLSHRAAGTLPVVILVSAGEDEKLTGFLEVGLRSQTSAKAGPRTGQLA